MMAHRISNNTVKSYEVVIPKRGEGSALRMPSSIRFLAPKNGARNDNSRFVVHNIVGITTTGENDPRKVVLMRLKAKRALSEMRREAASRGLEKTSLAIINREIRAVRVKRKLAI